MKLSLYGLLLLFAFQLRAQIPVEQQQDSLEYQYYIIEGDTIPRESIDLDEVIVFGKLKFKDDAERRRYLILRRKTRKVYPYAKLAADRLVELSARLDSMKSKGDKRRYMRIIQRYVEEEFTDELKKLTRTEGQILVKLIHRQTGITTFDLIKEFRSGWKAFWLNTTASMFDISLKEKFDPVNVEEDYYIEDILQRAFQAKLLENQPSALDFDYLELTNKWTKNPPENGVK
ncbi:MAG: DUF4294 domain-containing protein [Leeuwenhoekiella sp.]